MTPNMDFILKLIGTLTAVFGPMLAGIVWLWNRHEARRKALTEVGGSFVRVMYHLDRCKTSRLKREVLLRGFQEQGAQGKSIPYAKALLDDYNVNLQKAASSHADLECQAVTNRFRFSRHVNELMAHLRRVATEMGDAVNRGAFNECELRFVESKDLLDDLTRTARAWHTPLSVRRRLKSIRRKRNARKEGDQWITQQQMEVVMQLVHQRIEGHADSGFAIYPPRKLLEHAEILKGDDLVEQLRNEPFVVAFPDGRANKLTLAQVCAFVYQLIMLQTELPAVLGKIDATGASRVEVELQSTLDMRSVMKPAVVRLLLDKMDFSPGSAEDIAAAA